MGWLWCRGFWCRSGSGVVRFVKIAEVIVVIVVTAFVEFVKVVAKVVACLLFLIATLCNRPALVYLLPSICLPFPHAMKEFRIATSTIYCATMPHHQRWNVMTISHSDSPTLALTNAHLIRHRIGPPDLPRLRPLHLSMGRAVVHPLYDRLRNRRSAGGYRSLLPTYALPTAYAEITDCSTPRPAPTSLAFRYDFDFVGYCV